MTPWVLRPRWDKVPNGRIHNSLQNAAGADAELSIHATTADGDIMARAL